METAIFEESDFDYKMYTLNSSKNILSFPGPLEFFFLVWKKSAVENEFFHVKE